MALSKDQWAQIRRCWEYDPDRPSDAEAAKRAAEKFGFHAPRKQSVGDRRNAESWERKGVVDMASVNAAAQRKADKSTPQPVDGSPEAVAGAVATGSKKGAPKPDASAALSSSDEAEDLRAKVLSRHRQEWQQVVVLRQEALKKRHHPVENPGGSTVDAFDAMKLAKITAEATAIQQTGERKAWGLDVVVDPEQMKNMSDEQLQALAAGKVPPGMR